MEAQDLLSVFLELGLPSIKVEQIEVIEGILKRDVFAVLPTGFGKSACFQCLPGLFNRLFPHERSIVLVVTPLTAIIKNQYVCLLRFVLGF